MRPDESRGLVTGAAQGIGRAIAERLAGDGMRLTLIDIDPAVTTVAQELDAEALVLDLGSDSAPGVLRAHSNAGGPYWLIVNNAGVFSDVPMLEIGLEEWDRVQRVNARSMLIIMQALVPHMAASGAGGRIVNIASMAAKLGKPGEIAYAASKAAVVAMSRIAAMELGRNQITVNAICPGYVLTDMGADARTEDQIEAWKETSPLGRLGEPQDVAALVSFLASEEGGYLTGQAINVTGGMCTW